MQIEIIYCCKCEKEVQAELIFGNLVYTTRKDLQKTSFYQCPVCKSFVGTHKDTGKPLGCIAHQELKDARKHIHALIDPLFKSRLIYREVLYSEIASRLGIPEYHTAEIRSVEEARKVYKVCLEIEKELRGKKGND